ncbi:Lrp/AsnC family leucine-responsive transcriptional regulator [Bradyrhizobium sp. USDA 10063]
MAWSRCEFLPPAARKVLSISIGRFLLYYVKYHSKLPNLSQTPFIVKESSMTVSLDRIDLKILRLLQKNGRLSNAELADKAGVSPATCHRRTQRLFDEGFVKEVRAIVAPRKVGKGALVMVGVVLDRSTPESFASFEQAIAKLKFVLDCHLVAGDFDYFLKIRVGDMEDFNRIHGEQLIALPGVRQTRTFFVMKEVVDNAALEF